MLLIQEKTNIYGEGIISSVSKIKYLSYSVLVSSLIPSIIFWLESLLAFPFSPDSLSGFVFMAFSGESCGVCKQLVRLWFTRGCNSHSKQTGACGGEV